MNNQRTSRKNKKRERETETDSRNMRRNVITKGTKIGMLTFVTS